MSDRTLLIIIFLLELLAVYNLYDTVWVMLLHLSRRGVSASGTIAELKKAMRRLSKRWHPDMNPGQEAFAQKKFSC